MTLICDIMKKYVVSSDVMKWFRIIYRCVCIVQSSCMSNIMTFCLISVADCTNVLLLCLVVLYYTTLRYSAYVGYGTWVSVCVKHMLK